MKSLESSISGALPQLQSSQKVKHWFELVIMLVRRDLKVRYRGSIAGYLWTMMNPLVLMLVLTIVFTKIGRDKDPLYPLYVLSGILCWNVFSQGLLNGAHSIHSNGGLLKKVKVPQWVFPSVAILSALVNLIFALVPFIAVSFFVGLKLHFSLLFLPILLLLFFIFLLGIGLVVGTLNVMFRDIGHMLESGMLILFYSAPIAYPLSLVPERFQVFLHFHPVFYFLKGFRTVLCAYTFESFDWLMMVILSASALGLGLFTHSKLKNRLFYYL